MLVQISDNQKKKIFNLFRIKKIFKKIFKKFNKQILFCYIYKYFYLIFNYLNKMLYGVDKNYFFFKTFHMKKLKRIGSQKKLIFSKYRSIFPMNRVEHKAIFEIFYFSLKYKTLAYLVHFIKKLFKTVNFFKHQKLLFFLRFFFTFFKNELYMQFNITGVFMKFHGKIAKAGNSRKKKFLIRYNFISTCHTNNYLLEKFQIWTFTGAIGCTLVVSYKNS